MKSYTLIIDDHTDFKNLEIDKNLKKITIKWGSNISEQERSWLYHKTESFLYSLPHKANRLRILDISQLAGIDSFVPTKDYNCLVDVFFPDTVTYIYFEEAESLRSVHARGATKIHISRAPYLEFVDYGKALEELSLPETGITEITIPENVKLSNKAFRNCKDLRSVTLSKGVDLQTGTFENCFNLREVTLPDDLLVIEPAVFKNCYHLKYINGGKGVMHVFPSAFEGCKELERIDNCSFYKYTDLGYSDRDWAITIRPFMSNSADIQLIRNKIRKFVDCLKKQEIVNEESYLAKNFFSFSCIQECVLIKYESSVRRWIAWSLTEFKFYVTKNDGSHGLHEGDMISFKFESIPSITIDDQINIQFPEIYVIDLNNATIITKDNVYELGCDMDVLEYYNPKLSFAQKYKEIVDTISKLDISKIIDSYFIKAEVYWQTYPGRDDSEFYERTTKSDYSDAYLEKLLPQEHIRDYSNGCRPYDYDEDKKNKEIQLRANAEAKDLKEKAHKYYSKEEHIWTLMQDYIYKRKQFESYIELKYHILTAKRFLHYRYVNYADEIKCINKLYRYTWNDIQNDRKYYEEIERYSSPYDYILA